MPAKNPKKKSKNQVKSGFLMHLRQIVVQHPGVTFVIILVGSVAIASYAYNAITDFQDNQTAQQYKKQLDQIDKEMAIEFDAIIADLGTPASVSRDKTCEYVSADFDPGNPLCGASHRAKYNFSTVKSSDEFLANLKQGIVDAIGHEVSEIGMYPSSSEVEDSTRHIYGIYGVDHQVKCATEAYRGKNSQDGLVNFYVTFEYRCGKNSPKPIYREINK